MLIWQGKEYRRIILVGSSGSGKSYLSKELAAVTGYPLTHLDNEFWQPNWVGTPREDWIVRQKELMRTDTWILDGNYSDTLELRFRAADLVIFLDINRLVCVWSALRRNGKKRSDLPDFLEERFDREFLQFLKTVWNFPQQGRDIILELHGRHPDKGWIRLKSRKEVGQFLSSLKAAQAQSCK